MKTKKATSANPAAPATLTAPSTALVQAVQPDSMLMGSSSAGNRARAWNRWRERYNPLRGLNVSRCVTLLEQYQRGEMADPQWVYFFVEQSDADLFAILERRESALLQLDWNIKTISGRWSKDDPRQASFDKSLAAEQSQALREAYEGVDNLEEAFSHLQLATFRGFAHCEKYRNADGDIYHLEIVDQWNMVRDLLRGRWKYNPDATATTFYALPEANLVDPADFLIRERDRHVNRLALLKFIRSNLADKDWDAFIEIYGIPSGVVVGPPGVTPEKEGEFKSAAQSIAEGGSGYLPYQSTYTPNDSPRGIVPFRPRLDYLTEKLVLAGTGGLLTMLTQSGSGTLAGSAHQEAFDMIARAEAKKISGVFQRSFDSEVLEREFPGRDRLVYFEIAANDELDPDKVASQVKDLRAAGYRADVAQVSEKTGYTLFDATLPTKVDLREDAPGEDPDTLETQAQEAAADAAITNRAAAGLIQRLVKNLGAEKLRDTAPLCNRLSAVLAASDADFPGHFMSLCGDLHALCTTATADPASATALAQALSAALVGGQPATK
jgi:phage gp29-like protein